MSMMDVFRDMGRRDALDLRETAAQMTGTQLIAAEHSIPAFDQRKDYSEWPIGAPVEDDGQVWTLIQPHNAANYPDVRPATNRACWGLAHTTEPNRAKAWVAPHGTSGVYMKGECYKDAEGAVFRATEDNLVYPADVLPDKWEAVTDEQS